MTAVGPVIAINPPLDASSFEADVWSLEGVVRLLLDRRGLTDRALRSVVGFLVAEGRRFAETPSGERWTAVLEGSALATNGWLLWNMLDLDRYVTERDADPEGDTPAAMIEDVVRQLGALQLQEVVELVRHLAIEQEERDEHA